MFGRKKSKIEYDPAVSEPAVKRSICTGETTVGFIDIQTGKFHDLKLVTSQEEIDDFMRQTGVENIKTVY
ncbi:MAG: aspartate dehydrogenase [Clostridiales bacterium]|nr:aspartate dehydrogenase [Clostridiales bacterium]